MSSDTSHDQKIIVSLKHVCYEVNVLEWWENTIKYFLIKLIYIHYVPPLLSDLI